MITQTQKNKSFIIHSVRTYSTRSIRTLYPMSSETLPPLSLDFMAVIKVLAFQLMGRWSLTANLKSMTNVRLMLILMMTIVESLVLMTLRKSRIVLIVPQLVE